MAQAVTRGPVSGTATQRKKRKPFLLDLYSTAVGKKYVMAITGLIGVGFVIVHMIGNLKAYLGLVEHDGEMVYDIDVYGEFLRDLLVPMLPRTYALWILRLVLIGALVLHLHAAWSLTVMNRKARPVALPEPPRLRGGQLRQPHDALDRHHRPAVPRLAPRRLHVGLGQPRTSSAAPCTATSTPASPGCRWRSSTSSPTSPSASTCSTASGASSSRWAGTTPASTRGAGASPSPSPPSIVVGNCSFPIAVQAGIIEI